MIMLTERLKSMVDYIVKHPNCGVGEVGAALDIESTHACSYMSVLVKRGAVTRTGKRGYYAYEWSGEPYKVGEHVPVRAEPSITEVPDLMLDELANIKITEDQLLYLEGHTHLSRSELSRRLGITKLELNLVMDKRGIRSTFMPKDIDAASE